MDNNNHINSFNSSNQSINQFLPYDNNTDIGTPQTASFNPNGIHFSNTNNFNGLQIEQNGYFTDNFPAQKTQNQSFSFESLNSSSPQLNHFHNGSNRTLDQNLFQNPFLDEGLLPRNQHFQIEHPPFLPQNSFEQQNDQNNNTINPSNMNNSLQNQTPTTATNPQFPITFSPPSTPTKHFQYWSDQHEMNYDISFGEQNNIGNIGNIGNNLQKNTPNFQTNVNDMNHARIGQNIRNNSASLFDDFQSTVENSPTTLPVLQNPFAHHNIAQITPFSTGDNVSNIVLGSQNDNLLDGQNNYCSPFPNGPLTTSPTQLVTLDWEQSSPPDLDHD